MTLSGSCLCFSCWNWTNFVLHFTLSLLLLCA